MNFQIQQIFLFESKVLTNSYSIYEYDCLSFDKQFVK